MDIEGTDVAALPNGHIIVLCYYTGAINIYDEDFNLIKKVTEINHQAFKCLSSTSNNKDKIFISDFVNDKVIMTNFDFEYIKSYTIQQPYGVCFHHYLYTCCFNETKIYKHDENLKLILNEKIEIS